MSTAPKLFLLCTECNHFEKPSAEMMDKLEMEEDVVFPEHCGKAMTLTIKQVEVEKKVQTLDLEAFKRIPGNLLQVFAEKLMINNEVLRKYEQLFEENIKKNVNEDEKDVFEKAEQIKIAVQLSITAIPELEQEKNNILPFILGSMDVAIRSARNRVDGGVGTSEPVFSMESEDPEILEILSVGIDCGSSTTHLIFSKLTLVRESGFINLTRRFNVTEREILYESEIINTPLLDDDTIDIPGVVSFIKAEYSKAGYNTDEVDTGAVIVTGETAKKSNAAEIVELLSAETGKFVSATAGPNFESLLAALGSGATAKSQVAQKTILSVDIGGGTSNLAISSNGKVLSTSCINVGGRLLGMDNNFKIWRINEPAYVVMEELGISYEIGDTIPEEDVVKISDTFANALIEVMQGKAENKIAKQLMMTDDLDFSVPIDEIMFCGGVSEFIYGEPGAQFDDIGKYVANGLKNHDFGIPSIEPDNKIRATVIGAGSYSLAVSGSTCYYDEKFQLPVTNIPVLSIPGSYLTNGPALIQSIRNAYQKFDLVEGEDVVALYFDEWPDMSLIPSARESFDDMKDKSVLHLRDELIREFALNIEKALPNSIANNLPIIIVFQFDMAGMVGRFFTKETSIVRNYMFIDEVKLSEGDFIDIGAPLAETHSFPVTVKSLAFY